MRSVHSVRPWPISFVAITEQRLPVRGVIDDAESISTPKARHWPQRTAREKRSSLVRSASSAQLPQLGFLPREPARRLGRRRQAADGLGRAVPGGPTSQAKQMPRILPCADRIARSAIRAAAPPTKRFSAIQPTSRIAMPAKPRPMKRSRLLADDVLDQCRAGAGGKAEGAHVAGDPRDAVGSQIHFENAERQRDREDCQKSETETGFSWRDPAGIWLRPIGQGRVTTERCPGAEMA